MAGMFYSLQEAADKLNISEEQIKEIVKQGKLREFRDGPSLLFKVDEVDSLLSDTGIIATGDSAVSDEKVSEPEEEIISLDVSDTAEEIVAEEPEHELERPEEDMELSAEPSDESAFDLKGDLSSADTISSEAGTGLSEATEAGTHLIDESMGETKADSELEDLEEASLDELGDDVNLDTFGSGSGLLDLSLQADDTSLGGILDDIYTANGDEQQKPDASVEEVAAEMGEMTSDTDLTSQPAIAVHGYAELAPDSASNTFGLMLLLPLIMVIYTGMVAITGLFDIMPIVVEKARGYMVYILGGIIVVAIILAIMGFMAGSGGSADKPAKKSKPKAKPP